MDTVSVIVVFLILVLWCAINSAIIHGLRQDVNENANIFSRTLAAISQAFNSRLEKLERPPNKVVDCSVRGMKLKKFGSTSKG